MSMFLFSLVECLFSSKREISGYKATTLTPTDLAEKGCPPVIDRQKHLLAQCEPLLAFQRYSMYLREKLILL